MKQTKIKLLSTLFILGILVSATMLATNPKEVHAASGITVTPSSTGLSGIPGSVVTYNLSISNTSGSDVTLNIDATNASSDWTDATITPKIVTIAAGSPSIPTIVTVAVNIPIPSSVTNGQNDVTTLTFTGASESIDPIQLTTTASSPVSYSKPLLAVSSFSVDPKIVHGGTTATLSLVLENRGQKSAMNVVVTFAGTSIYPMSSGGVQTIGNIEPGGKATFTQSILVGDDLTWSDAASVTATAVFTDSSGTAYTDTFNLTVKINEPSSSSLATATPKASQKPQLVITANKTDIDPLQPGSIFNLTLDVKNLGASDAKHVTMVLGGGASSLVDTGTPQPGGVSGSSGDLSSFAPLGSSNIVVVGDIKQGETVQVSQELVANVTIQPGAYTLKISFVYTDGGGNRMVDDQVITLLVYSLPQVEISFYTTPMEFMVGMPGTLPLQVTNLGKKSSVLGNMNVNAMNATISNNVSLVGALESGGYYTLDSMITPMQEGPLDIEVTINYTDDFNQPRYISQTLTINVLPAPAMEPTPEGGDMNGEMYPVDPATETFWSKIGRFFKGLFGLGSGTNSTEPVSTEFAPEDSSQPIVIPKG